MNGTFRIIALISEYFSSHLSLSNVELFVIWKVTIIDSSWLDLGFTCYISENKTKKTAMTAFLRKYYFDFDSFVS